MEKVLLTVAEVVKLTGWSRAHIYNEINRGQLPTVRLGRTTRIPAAYLEKIVNEACNWGEK